MISIEWLGEPLNCWHVHGHKVESWSLGKERSRILETLGYLMDLEENKPHS